MRPAPVGERCAMRVETIKAWIFLGFAVLATGTLLYVLQVAGQLGRFLGVIGFVYFGIGIVLGVVHDRQMQTRTRAGLERE